MVHKLKDSRINSEDKNGRKATNPLARFLHRKLFRMVTFSSSDYISYMLFSVFIIEKSAKNT